MHDATRRIICRIAFVALCLVPTIAVCAWVVYRATPIHAWRVRAAWERAIFDRTGLLASIECVRRPNLQRTLLDGVTLLDPDGNKQVASIRVVEVSETAHGMVVNCSQPEINQGQLARLGDAFHRRLIRGPTLPAPLRVTIGEVTLKTATSASTLSDVNCVVGRRGQSVHGSIEFWLAGVESPNPVQLQFTRERAINDPVTVWQIRTGSASLPCELLADHVPVLRALGSRSHFNGTAWIEQSATTWGGEIAGRFRDVDLDELMAPFPHKLSGIAEITLSHSRFRNGRLTDIAGSLHSSGGAVSRSLLNAAADSLQMTTVAADAEDDSLLAYSQLAFGFQLDGEELKLSGLCKSTGGDVVMIGRGGDPLLVASHQSVRSVALTTTLVPHNEVQVPATRATELLLRALPLPQITVSPARTAILPSPRVRVAPR